MIRDSGDAEPATFWVPRTRRRLQGTYKWTANEGVEISLVGTPSGTADLSVAPVLWGDVSGTRVTCEDVWPLSVHGLGKQIRSRYAATRAFEGAHFSDPVRHQFVAATLTLSRLPAFRHVLLINPREPSECPQRDQYRHAVSVPAVGEVIFESAVEQAWAGFPESLTLSARHHVSLVPSRPCTWRTLWREMVMPINGLLTLAAHESSRVLDVHLSPKTNGSRGGVRVRTRNPVRDDYTVYPSQMLMSFANWDVNAMLPEWFRLWNACPTAFTSFSASLDTSEPGSRLLHAVGACEALDRVLHPLPEHDPRRISRVERVLATNISQRDRAWATRLLSVRNEQTLENRLKRLARGLEQGLAGEMLGDVSRWARHVAEARNALSHSKHSAADFNSDPRLVYQMASTLQYVFGQIVMQLVGFSGETAAERYRHNGYLQQSIGLYPAMVQGPRIPWL